MSDKIDTPRLEAKEGPCRKCGKQTLIFYGKLYCDRCCAEWEREQVREQRIKKWEEHLKAAAARGLLCPDPKRYLFSRSKEEYEAMNPEAWALARRLRTDKHVYIYGNVGVGKSHLARCVLIRAAADMTIADVSARRLIKAGVRFDEGKGLFAYCCEAGMLLLDDIDKIRVSDDNLGVLWDLMERRAQARKYTIVTSNFAPVELGKHWTQSGKLDTNEHLPGATLNRLYPKHTIEMRGKSLRQLIDNSEE